MGDAAGRHRARVCVSLLIVLCQLSTERPFNASTTECHHFLFVMTVTERVNVCVKKKKPCCVRDRKIGREACENTLAHFDL